MEQGGLFPLITDSRTRSRILGRLKETNHIIPTLYTFFEDTKWLEPCAKILRMLVPPGCKKTIKRSLFACFGGKRKTQGILFVQTGGNNFTGNEVSEHELVELGYRQLWLFAWRHFPELSALLPRRDQGKAKPQTKALNELCLRELALVADNLGFQSDNITRFMKQDTDLEMAIAFLQRARPQEIFDLSNERRMNAVNHIYQILASIERPVSTAIDTSDSAFESEVIINNRCGRPFEQSFKYTRPRFFLPEFYKPRERKVSHFSVNQDIFIAFFGLMDFNFEPESPQRGGLKRVRTGKAVQDPDQTSDAREAGSSNSEPDPHHAEGGQPPQTFEAVDDNGYDTDGCDMRMVLHHEAVQRKDEVVASSEGGQLIIPPPPDVGKLENSQLFEIWNSCEAGSICLVSISGATAKCLTPHEGNKLPEEILLLANDNWFAHLQPRRPLQPIQKKIRWGYIDVGNVWRFRKGRAYNGIIYYHARHSDADPEPLIPPGDTTKAHLYEIEAKFKRKKRRQLDSETQEA